ncbi:MAG: hypothetical protein KGI71_06610 [Patescibacteria group bacterium]|nr:hypothetical protein [Patescibacteria group bacterium]
MSEVSTHIAEDLKNAGPKPPVTEEIIDNDAAGTQGIEDEDFGGATEADIRFARDNGWTPKANWRGDPEKYENAKDFANRARGINALLQRKLSKYESDLEQIRADVRTMTEGARAGQLKNIEAKIVETRARRVDAINNGDGKGVDDAERELGELNQQRIALTTPDTRASVAPAAPTAPAAAPLSPKDQAASEAWMERNPWIETDKRLARLAFPITQEIRQERPDLIGPGKVGVFLEELERRVKEEYPEYFPAERPRSRTTESTAPRNVAGASKQRTFANLPKEAQEACDRLIERGIVRKREDYVKNYQWE